ncbi:MAG TPA: NAD(P)H-hydrate dehydratase [Chthoniobacterales bacterium]
MPPVLPTAEVVALEKAAFARGVEPWSLMLEAGRQIAEAVRQFCPKPASALAFVGKGNNGGDALVALKFLFDAGWQIDWDLTFSPEQMSPLAYRALEILLRETSRAPVAPHVILDGLLGAGATGNLRSPIQEKVLEINELRRDTGAIVFALDLPSGIEGEYVTEAVMADHTLAIGFAKETLLRDKATNNVGRLSVLPLNDLVAPTADRDEVSTAADLRALLPPRGFDVHKGDVGRVGIVAGSFGTAGAAVLATNGALRAGAGLVTAFCPSGIHPTLAPMMSPEVMLQPWEPDMAAIAKGNFDALAIGPGLSPEFSDQAAQLLRAVRVPVVLDAGALTILAKQTGLLEEMQVPILLTPHPGEMERLFPRNERSRRDWAKDFVAAQKPRTTVLLKGARTVIVESDKAAAFNPAGHPGMATGGMGDTLTGVCSALIGQGLSVFDAARVGAWVCGRAAEIAVWEDGFSQESLLPSDVALRLGRAFADLRRGVF